MSLAISSEDADPGEVREAIEQLVEAELTAAFAAIADGAVSAWTAYVASDWPVLFFTSQETSRHARAIGAGAPAAVVIWQRPTAWGGKLWGLQINGYCAPITEQITAEHGLEALHRRFPGTRNTVPTVDKVVGPNRSTVLFEFRVESGTVIDEERLGPKLFVDFSTTI